MNIIIGWSRWFIYISLCSSSLNSYLFVGGGKKVTRVEVTLDGGQTWLLCVLDHPEKPTKYGRCWCWCFWSIDVELADLLACKEIAVRAWDQSLNTQPEFLTWNLLVHACWHGTVSCS